MDGNWFTFGNSNVYGSTTRSMARFGLMIYARGKCGNIQNVSENFLSQPTTTSQNINDALAIYGGSTESQRTTYHKQN